MAELSWTGGPPASNQPGDSRVMSYHDHGLQFYTDSKHSNNMTLEFYQSGILFESY